MAQPLDLQLGMVAGVQGQRNALDATLGTAQAIEVWSIAQGPVTSVRVDSFVVLGMTFHTDSNTTYDGTGAASPLAAGQSVSVWGLQVDAAATQWKIGKDIEAYGTWSSGVLVATQIVLEGEGDREIDMAAKIDQFTSVSDFVVRGQRCNAAAAKFSGGQAADLAVGKKIKVEGTMAANVLMVSKLEFD